MTRRTPDAAGSAARPKSDYLVYRAIDAALRHGLRLLPPSDFAESVALWWGYRFRPPASVAKLRSGALIHVDSVDYLQLLIYYLGTFEPHCLRYVRRCAPTGGTVVDVGANIGVYSLEGSLAVGPSGRVIALEAAPPHVDALRRNLQLNAMGNVSVVEVAVGEVPGEATLGLRKGANLGMFTVAPGGGEEAYRVEVRRLDDVLQDLGVRDVDLIKMDIEGSEFRALRGASRTLAQCKPTLLVELNDDALERCGSSTGEVKRLLREAGYRGWLLTRGGSLPIPEAQPTHGCVECIYIHRDKVALIGKLRLPGA